MPCRRGASVDCLSETEKYGKKLRCTVLSVQSATILVLIERYNAVFHIIGYSDCSAFPDTDSGSCALVAYYFRAGQVFLRLPAEAN